jgi:mannose-6-phosphate isomerase-like protein (cupin superfamily)
MKVFKIDELPESKAPDGSGSWRTLGKDAGAKNCNVLVISVKPGAKPKPDLHYHPRREEIFVVMQGKAKATIDGKEVILEPGMAILAPAGEKHYMRLLATPIGKKPFVMLEAGAPMEGETVHL